MDLRSFLAAVTTSLGVLRVLTVPPEGEEEGVTREALEGGNMVVREAFTETKKTKTV